MLLFNMLGGTYADVKIKDLFVRRGEKICLWEVVRKGFIFLYVDEYVDLLSSDNICVAPKLKCYLIMSILIKCINY